MAPSTGRICIDAQVLGTARHVLLNEGVESEVDTIPDDAWHLTGAQKDDSERCADTLLAVERLSFPTDPPEVYVSSYKASVPDDRWPPPWRSCMPARAHQRHVETIKRQVREAMAKADPRFYVGFWRIQTAVFQSLHRVTVREEVYDRLVKENPDNKTLQTFQPNRRELAERIMYDRTSTRTGRLTVASGPDILVLRKDLRKVMCPSGPNRRIASYDYRACEMSVLLYEAGHPTVVGDLYEQIRRDHLPQHTRSVVKGAVIRRTYGSVPHVWGPELNLSLGEAKRIDAILENIFATSSLASRLKSDYDAHGFIRDAYHRKVVPSSGEAHVLVNAYAQATGNDVALLGFASLLRGFDRLDVRPVFLLHDSLFFDAPDECVSKLRSLNSMKVPTYDQRYLVQFSELCDTPEEA